jgi:hypothetical protein
VEGALQSWLGAFPREASYEDLRVLWESGGGFAEGGQQCSSHRLQQEWWVKWINLIFFKLCTHVLHIAHTCMSKSQLFDHDSCVELELYWHTSTCGKQSSALLCDLDAMEIVHVQYSIVQYFISGAPEDSTGIPSVQMRMRPAQALEDSTCIDADHMWRFHPCSSQLSLFVPLCK